MGLIVVPLTIGSANRQRSIDVNHVLHSESNATDRNPRTELPTESRKTH
jgi:hypothetical protein